MNAGSDSYPPSPNTPDMSGDEGVFAGGFGGISPQGTAKDGFLRSSAKQSEGESSGTPRLRGGLHLKSIRQSLETEKAFGVFEIPCCVGAGAKGISGQDAAAKQKALRTLEREFADCRLCPLAETRARLVFGSGNAAARLMFVGEAPGYEEDQQGLPFVGAAGQLLTKIIQAMKLKREEVYIANVLKCRPPNNRSPLPSEIAICKAILVRQVEMIQPQIICALGKHAAQTLLGTEEPISRIRGLFFDWNGAKLMPTFHPAYLLRNPGDKKLVWEDMQKIMRKLDLNDK